MQRSSEFGRHAVRYGVRTCLALALVFAIVSSEAHAAEIDASLVDGWNAWRVAAATDSTRCCYSWSVGRPMPKTCDLDGERSIALRHGDRRLSTNREVQIYVRVSGGEADRIVALSPQCPIAADAAVNDLGIVNTSSSISWLERFVDSGNRLAEDSLDAIGAHQGSTPVLIATAERRELPLKMREIAIYLMVQSESDDAFEYIARLVSEK